MSYSEFKPVDGDRIVDDVIQGLINAGMIKEEDRRDIVDTWVFNAKYSYPTPSVERDDILAKAIPSRAARHLLPRASACGSTKSPTPTTPDAGVELVNRLINGEAETTIGMKYASTVDGRNAAVHERSHVAGSGDPKKSAESGGKRFRRFAQTDAPGGKQPRREASWAVIDPGREPATPGESNTTKAGGRLSVPSDTQPGERLVAAGKV